MTSPIIEEDIHVQNQTATNPTWNTWYIFRPTQPGLLNLGLQGHLKANLARRDGSFMDNSDNMSFIQPQSLDLRKPLSFYLYLYLWTDFFKCWKITFLFQNNYKMGIISKLVMLRFAIFAFHVYKEIFNFSANIEYWIFRSTREHPPYSTEGQVLPGTFSLKSNTKPYLAFDSRCLSSCCKIKFMSFS